MNISRPGKNQRPATKSSGKFYITLFLIAGVIALFWSNLKEFQTTENKKIESNSDYLPVPAIGTVYSKPFFSLSYVEKYELPEWVAYRLTSDMLDKPNHPRNQEFEPDPAIRTHSAHYHDYKQSGYSKGHLVPSADMSWDLPAMNATFLMSNVAPMKESFNSGIWLELEHDVRDWAKQHKNIIVITGPLFSDSLGAIGSNKVLVPKYFYKAIFSNQNGKPEAIGFILDQTFRSSATLDQYIVSIDSIEKLTHLDLFANLYGSWEKEINIEKEKPKSTKAWPLNPYWYQQRIENQK